MTTVLVTGANGTVGSRVVGEMQKLGVPLRVLVRYGDAAAARFGAGVEISEGDFSDRDSVARAVKGVDQLFLACPNLPQQVQYETAVIDAAVGAGVRRIVKLSAVGAQPGARLEFWDWQGRIEDHLAGAGIPAVVIRPSNYMTNLLASADAVAGTGTLFAPAGGARVAMIDPADVAAVAAVALSADRYTGRTLVVTGPEALTFEQVARHLSDATGRRIEFVDVPGEAAAAGMLQSGMPEWLVRNLLILFEALRDGAAANVTNTVREITRRSPRTFAEFARDHAHRFVR